jgi:hypothetical protein
VKDFSTELRVSQCVGDIHYCGVNNLQISHKSKNPVQMRISGFVKASKINKFQFDMGNHKTLSSQAPGLQDHNHTYLDVWSGIMGLCQ